MINDFRTKRFKSEPTKCNHNYNIHSHFHPIRTSLITQEELSSTFAARSDQTTGMPANQRGRIGGGVSGGAVRKKRDARHKRQAEGLVQFDIPASKSSIYLFIFLLLFIYLSIIYYLSIVYLSVVYLSIIYLSIIYLSIYYQYISM